MKKSIVIAIALICIAALIILNGLGVTLGLEFYGLTIWRAILAVVFLALFVLCLVKKKFAFSPIPLACAFMSVEPTIAILCGLENENIIDNWVLILAAVILGIAIGLLTRNGTKKVTGTFKATKARGNSIVYMDMAELGCHTVDNSFGESELYLENAEGYTGEGTINIHNSFGSTSIFVPKGIKVVSNVENAFGEVKCGCNDFEAPKTLNVDGGNSFGSVSIQYRE